MGLFSPIMRLISRNVSSQPPGMENPQVETFLRRAYGTHFVTLWLFPNIQTLNTLNERGLYPRNRQTLPPMYQHLPSVSVGYYENFQQFVDNLMTHEGAGEVRGIYLGWSDIVHFRVPFELNIPQSMVLNPAVLDQLYPRKSDGPVIALGAANLSFHFDKHYIKKLKNQIKGGVLHSTLDRLQFDWEKPQWKWIACNFEGLNIEGIITGRILAAEPDPANPGHSRIEHVHTRLPLQNAQEAQREFERQPPQTGLKHPIKAMIGNRIIAQNVADENGRFALNIHRADFNQRILLVSPRDGDRQEGQHPEGWPTDPAQITLNDAHRVFCHAIVPKLKKEHSPPKEQEVVIAPNSPEPDPQHMASLQHPFGTTEILTENFPLPANTSHEATIDFRIKKPNSKSEALYHLFFMEVNLTGKPKVINLNELQNRYGIMPGNITFKVRNKPQHIKQYTTNLAANQGQFYHQFEVSASVTINVALNFRNPETGLHAIFLFASVQEHAPPQGITQEALDIMMFKFARGEAVQPATLRQYGVLDFNYSPVFLINNLSPTQPQPQLNP
ncbi:hypothetical protein JW756_00590 [Candidatus Woesearchaeota archaeon]|nr:hypothetical protein [Candidatus Woesearchaeota archaeon]